MKKSILLVAINARFSHTSFAALSLLANLGPLREKAEILERELDTTPWQLAAEIAARSPHAVAFIAYLWNIRTIEATARILRTVHPAARLLVGGPEITKSYTGAEFFDSLIVGEGESTLRTALSTPAPEKWIISSPENVDTLVLPYAFYTDADLAHRIIYVESSRGCPCGCAYCTSAHTGLRLIPLTRLLPELDALLARGLRCFKFLDRSFNAPVAHACTLLDFFLARLSPELRLHFEIQPELLNPEIAQKLAAFPPGTLHLEAGVQTLNPSVARAVGRTGEIDRLLGTLDTLMHHTGATVHVDLIFGLPGENEVSFAAGFDTLVKRLAPPELQVNLLKGLPGTALVRDAQRLGLRFNPEPPYEVIQTDVLDFSTLARMQAFARCWELVHNRGRLPEAAARLDTSPSPYFAYSALAQNLLHAEGKLFALSLPRLAARVEEFFRHNEDEGSAIGSNPLDRNPYSPFVPPPCLPVPIGERRREENHESTRINTNGKNDRGGDVAVCEVRRGK